MGRTRLVVSRRSVLVILLWGVVSCVQGVRTSITIGGTLSFSGRYASISEKVLKAYLLLRDEVNNNTVGGLMLDDGNTYTLEYYFEDDGSDPSLVSTLYHEMVTPNRTTECFNVSGPCFRSSNLAGWQPDILLAPYGIELGAEAVPIADAAGFVIVSGSTLNSTILEGTEYAFGAGLSLSKAVLQGLRELLPFGMRSVAYMSSEDPSESQVCGEVSDGVEKLNDRLALAGLETIRTENIGSVTTAHDLQSRMADMRMVNPDVALACLPLDLCLAFLRIANQTNFEPPAIMFPTCVTHQDFRSLARRKGDYVIGALPWQLESASFQDLGISMKSWRLAESESQSASLSIGYHYVAALALTHAVTQAQSVRPLKVAHELRKLHARTIFGDLYFDYKGQNAAEPTIIQFNPQPLVPITNQTNYRQLWPQTGPLVAPLYPARSLRQRTCELDHDPNSCHCTLEGCPACSEEHWRSNVSTCTNSGAYGTRAITYAWNSPCSGGLSLPESRDDWVQLCGKRFHHRLRCCELDRGCSPVMHLSRNAMHVLCLTTFSSKFGSVELNFACNSWRNGA